MDVYIGIDYKNNNGTYVYPARDYQTSAFITYMSKKSETLHFSFNNNINFRLEKMNTEGLKCDYSRFCVLVNESGEKHILSDNEELLRGYVGWRNRLTLI